MGFEIVRVTCRGWYGSCQPWFRIVREMLAANRPLSRRRWQASARHHLRTTGGSLWQLSSSSQLEIYSWSVSYCLSSQLLTALPLLPAAKRPSLSPMIPNIFSAMYTCRWHCTMMTQRVYIYQVDGAQVISRNATLCSNSSSVKQQELPLDHCCLCVVQKCCAIQRGGKQGPAIAKSGNAIAAISRLRRINNNQQQLISCNGRGVPSSCCYLWKSQVFLLHLDLSVDQGKKKTKKKSWKNAAVSTQRRRVVVVQTRAQQSAATATVISSFGSPHKYYDYAAALFLAHMIPKLIVFR